MKKTLPILISILLSTNAIAIDIENDNQTNVLHFYTSIEDQKNIKKTINTTDLKLEQKNNNGNNNFHIMAKNDLKKSFYAIAPFIKDNNVLNIKNNKNHTPLIISAMNSSYNIAYMLIENGANPNIKNNLNKNAFDYAKEKNDTLMLDILNKKNIKSLEEKEKILIELQNKLKNKKNNKKEEIINQISYYTILLSKKDKQIKNSILLPPIGQTEKFL